MCGDLVALDEAWEEAPPPPSGEIRDFPFQQALFCFLDSHAPLPGQFVRERVGGREWHATYYVGGSAVRIKECIR